MDNHKSTKSVLLMNMNAGLGALSYGFALGYINVSFRDLHSIYQIPESQQAFVDGVITFLFPVGGMVGSLLTEKLTRVYSPRNSMMIVDLMNIAGLLIQQIPLLSFLYLARVIIGLSTGLNSSLIPSYNKQFTPLSLSGVAGSLFAVQLSIGFLLSLALGLGYDEEVSQTYWRFVFIFPIVFSILRLFTLNFIYTDEPAAYYIKAGLPLRAKEVLSTIYLDEHVEGIYKQHVTEIKSLQNVQESYSDLLKPHMKRRLIAGLFVGFLSQASGSNIIVFYSTQIFQSISPNQTVVNALNIIYGVANTILTLGSGVLMKYYGRKQLFLRSCLVCLWSLVILGSFSYISKQVDSSLIQLIAILPIFSHLVGFNVGLGPVTWVYWTDILNQQGISVCVANLWLVGGAVGFTFPLLVQAIGIELCFIFFAVVCLINYYIANVIVVETKDKTPMEIQKLFNKNSLSESLMDSVELTQV